MSLLGDLLERLNGAEPPFGTLRASYKVWRYESSSRDPEAVAYSYPLRVAEPVGSVDGWSGSVGEVSIWRVWPDSGRVEWRSGPRAGEFVVINGSEWSGWTPDHGPVSSDHPGGQGDEFGVLFEPRRLLAQMRFELVGQAVRAGQRVVVVDAHVNDDVMFRRVEWLPVAVRSERYRLEIDAQRGIVLAWHTLIDDRGLPQFEATDVAFEEPLSDALFRFAAPAELPLSSGLRDGRWSVSVSEAQALASFTVLMPKRVPKGWMLDCTYITGNDDEPPAVYLHYMSPVSDEAVTLAQTATQDAMPSLPESGWREIKINDRTLRVRGGDEQRIESQLVTRRDGTCVVMNSTALSTEDLVAFERLLTRAPTAS